MRRGTAWDDKLVNFSVANGSATSAIELVTNVADNEKRGCTLVRLLLDLYLWPATPGNVSGRQNYDLGVALISDDARLASAFPDPDDAADYPVSGWLWRTRVLVIDETLATGPIPPGRVKEDIRAQRKLDRSSVMLINNNTLVEGNPFTVQVTGIIRVLYKLP